MDVQIIHLVDLLHEMSRKMLIDEYIPLVLLGAFQLVRLDQHKLSAPYAEVEGHDHQLQHLRAYLVLDVLIDLEQLLIIQNLVLLDALLAPWTRLGGQHLFVLLIENRPQLIN